jgi:hypothetical protein
MQTKGRTPHASGQNRWLKGIRKVGGGRERTENIGRLERFFFFFLWY